MSDLRTALQEIVDDSPNWMVPDAIVEHARHMQSIARAALDSLPPGSIVITEADRAALLRVLGDAADHGIIGAAAIFRELRR